MMDLMQTNEMTKSSTLILNNDPNVLEQFLQKIEKTAQYSFDVEHHPDIPPHHKDFVEKGFWGYSFCSDDLKLWVTDKDLLAKMLKVLFLLEYTKDGREIEAIAYNGKYDLKCAKIMGWLDIYPRFFCDPMVAINLVYDNLHPNQLGLKYTVKTNFNYEMKEFDEVAHHGPNSLEFRNYTCDDARWEVATWNWIKPQLIKEGVFDYFRKISMESLKTFTEMEHVGIGWDLEESNRLLHGYLQLQHQFRGEIFQELGPINLNSPKQLNKRLFDDLGYSPAGLKETKTGYSLDEDSMDILAKKYPICKKIVLFRNCSKMLGTYIEPLTNAALADPKGRIHPTIWTVSSTGRTRMSDPNFQNIPAYLKEDFKHLSIRKAVIPAPGKKLLICDFSQIELRIAAHITGDKTLLRAYQNYTCTKCGAKGSESSKIHHSCPHCGEPENEDTLKICTKCKRSHIKPKKNPSGEIIGCPCCLEGADYETVKIKGFWHGLDLHQETADDIKGLKGSRPQAKNSNFALIYLAGAYRLNQQHPQISVDEWEIIIDQWFEKFHGVHLWHLKMEKALQENGVCTDVFGRRRRIPKRDIHIHFKHALNMFVNAPIQGSAGGLAQLTGVKIAKAFGFNSGKKNVPWMDKIYASNFVHDEFVYEADEDFIEEAIPVIRHNMEQSVKFKVPIRVDIKVSDNWNVK